MKDNFNMHSWRLKQAINELDEKQCPDCGCKMEGQMCNECGYLEEATFTGKHDDNPKLKGGQKDLPDEVQAKIVAKEDTNLTERKFEVDDIVKVKATGKKGKVVDMSSDETFFIVNIDGKNSSFYESSLELIKRPSLNETEDHEVSMAQASLKSIIGAASELMNKIGNEEFDIPGWIQDHITNSENYISQANKGYHKLDNEYED